jgi:site-specific DNA recombinase
VRSDQLEQIVWDQVRALLEEPHRVADEYRGRMARARDGAATPDEILRLDRQIATLRRGIGRLIDSYAENVIDKAEFEPRITGLKQRMSQLQERYQEARDAAEVERNLSLVISRLEDFSAKVTNGLDGLDRSGMRDVIRILVRRIEIDDGHIEVVFRVPSPEGSRSPPTNESGSWQHCTGVGRAHARMDQPQPSPCARLRALRAIRRRLRSPRHDPHHAQTLDQVSSLFLNPNFLDRL